MADTKVSAAADPGTLVATDKVPMARSASTTAYAATVAEIAAFANGAYTPNYATATPTMDGTGAAGTASTVSRGDHKHPTDTTLLSRGGGTMTGTLVLAADPAAPLQAATKQYVDGSAPVGGPYVSIANMHDVGRNLIHNPLFNVAQRGAGPFTTGMFTLDRWQMAVVGAGGSMNVQQMQLVDAARAQIGDEQAAAYVYAQVTAGTNPTDYKLLQQKTEGVRRLAGKTVTVSFYAASSAGLPVGVNLQQDFGTGGSPSAMVVVPGQAITLTTGWARYTATFVAPSIAGKTLGTAGDDGTTLVFWFSAGTNYDTNSGSLGLRTQNVSLWGVQLEVGSVATPLEKPDPRYDLSDCQRMFVTFPVLVPATAAPSNLVFPTTMRAAPAVAGGGAGFATSNLSTIAVTVSQTTAAAQTLTFSADL